MLLAAARVVGGALPEVHRVLPRGVRTLRLIEVGRVLTVVVHRFEDGRVGVGTGVTGVRGLLVGLAGIVLSIALVVGAGTAAGAAAGGTAAAAVADDEGYGQNYPGQAYEPVSYTHLTLPTKA